MLYDNEEVFLVEGPEENDILYVPLRGYAAYVPKGCGVLEDEEFMDAFAERMRGRELFDVRKALDEAHRTLPELSIPVTDDCNLRCVYCYASAGDCGHTGTFTEGMIDSVLDAYFGFLERHRDEYLSGGRRRIPVVLAGGGEPTSRPELFRHTVERAKELAAGLGLECAFSMPTNLTCGPDLMDYIIENFDSLSVSMDGPEDIQDSHRPRRDGSGSYKAVMRNLEKLKGTNMNFGFRVTVTKDSVGRMEEIADFFNEVCPGHGISFEKVHVMGRMSSEDDFPDDLFNERFQELLSYAKGKGIPVRNAIMRKFDSISLVFCRSVGVPNWTVTPDGGIASCTRDNAPEVFRFGRFDFERKEFVIDEEKIRRIRDMNVLNYPGCRDCFCKYICAGDCPDLRIISKPNCDLTRELGARELNDLLSKE